MTFLYCSGMTLSLCYDIFACR